jgi:hypothetical protein
VVPKMYSSASPPDPPPHTVLGAMHAKTQRQKMRIESMTACHACVGLGLLGGGRWWSVGQSVGQSPRTTMHAHACTTRIWGCFRPFHPSIRAYPPTYIRSTPTKHATPPKTKPRHPPKNKRTCTNHWAINRTLRSMWSRPDMYTHFHRSTFSGRMSLSKKPRHTTGMARKKL